MGRNANALVNIGIQRYDRLREQEQFYIDKTDFIREWWENGSDVTLITRPRRFGKTLNMSMLECFFSDQYAGRSDLFEGLSIWSEEKYRELQGTFPVIFMSFAGIKAGKYADMEYTVTKTIADLYEQNRYLLEGDLLSGNEREYYENINREWMPESRRMLSVRWLISCSVFMERMSSSFSMSTILRCRRPGYQATGMKRPIF